MNGRILLTLICVAAAGTAAGYLLGSRAAIPPSDDATAATGERRVLYWVAPMDPAYRRDGPGKSPMGMDLIPVYEDATKAAGAVVTIDPAVVNNLGVRTATAELGTLNAPVRTVGRVTYNEEQTAHIHLRAEGWIQHLSVRAQGELVDAGELLFDVYSPELINAQSEFVRALTGGRRDLIDASRTRLQALGMAQSQINTVSRSRAPAQFVAFYAPISGVITELNVADGKFATPATEVMAISDTSTVWIISDVFEAEVDRVAVGAQVQAVTKFHPGEAIAGRVDYVYPDLNPVTRTVAVRTMVANPDRRLKPGMFVTSTISGPPRAPAVIIPSEALIRTGRQERVIVALEKGRFRPAEVVSGQEADGRIEILSGLQAGDQVVVSGQFLLDSESSFSGAAMRMSGAETAHD